MNEIAKAVWTKCVPSQREVIMQKKTEKAHMQFLIVTGLFWEKPEQCQPNDEGTP